MAASRAPTLGSLLRPPLGSLTHEAETERREGGGPPMTHSRNKGKRGERELVRLLRAEGFDARRGQQFRGTPDSPDVLVADRPWLHLEVKRTERFRIYDAIDQARRDAGEGQMPVVAYRANRCRWLAVVDLRDFLVLAREVCCPPLHGAAAGFDREEGDDEGGARAGPPGARPGPLGASPEGGPGALSRGSLTGGRAPPRAWSATLRAPPGRAGRGSEGGVGDRVKATPRPAVWRGARRPFLSLWRGE